MVALWDSTNSWEEGAVAPRKGKSYEVRGAHSIAVPKTTVKGEAMASAKSMVNRVGPEEILKSFKCC